MVSRSDPVSVAAAVKVGEAVDKLIELAKQTGTDLGFDPALGKGWADATRHDVGNMAQTIIDLKNEMEEKYDKLHMMMGRGSTRWQM